MSGDAQCEVPHEHSDDAEGVHAHGVPGVNGAQRVVMVHRRPREQTLRHHDGRHTG